MSSTTWLSYSLQDVIMFSPEVYLRLTVRANEQLWPWVLMFAVMAISIPLLAGSRRDGSRRLAVGLLGLCWVGSGYVFLIRLYGPINWPAEYFGWAFILQGVVFWLLAAFAKPIETIGRAIVILWLAAVCSLPMLLAFQAGDWRSLALFGVSPEVTAAVSVLLLPGFSRPWRGLLLVLPLLWSLFAGLVYWGLGLVLLLLIPVLTLVHAGLARKLSPNPAQIPD